MKHFVSNAVNCVIHSTGREEVLTCTCGWCNQLAHVTPAVHDWPIDPYWSYPTCNMSSTASECSMLLEQLVAGALCPQTGSLCPAGQRPHSTSWCQCTLEAADWLWLEGREEAHSCARSLGGPVGRGQIVLSAPARFYQRRQKLYSSSNDSLCWTNHCGHYQLWNCLVQCQHLCSEI